MSAPTTPAGPVLEPGPAAQKPTSGRCKAGRHGGCSYTQTRCACDCHLDPAKVCKQCGEMRPPGRRVYCGDSCDSLARAARQRAAAEKKQAACQRCSGPKEPGTRGSRYCNECRRLSADANAQMEHERSRRKNAAVIAARLAGGGRIARRNADAPDGQKWCARCQEFRPFASFPTRKTEKKATYCKPCQRGYNRERRVLLQFGLTWEQYDFLLANQDGRCAICEGKPRKYALAVDHDHRTGEIRGLLCSRCNHKLLGSANDDPARLRKAADYLEQFTPREVFGEAKYVPGFGAA